MNFKRIFCGVLFLLSVSFLYAQNSYFFHNVLLINIMVVFKMVDYTYCSPPFDFHGQTSLLNRHIYFNKRGMPGQVNFNRFSIARGTTVWYNKATKNCEVDTI